MIYLICFCITFAMLIYVLSFEKKPSATFVLLLTVILVSNGGYYAIAASVDLDEAILATKVSYLAGIFGPMLIFLIVAHICKIHIPGFVKCIMHTVQGLLYMAVLTAGQLGVFYQSVEYNKGPHGAYLTKVYGPLHTVYLISMIFYMLATVVAAFYSLNKKSVVSRINVQIILLAMALIMSLYMVERIAHLQIELLPMGMIFGLTVMIAPLRKITDYSIDNIHSNIDDIIQKTGYIIFNQNLMFMGSNIYATDLFPELNEWELEEKIPGNGGRFNTFLRQPLMEYVKENDHENIEDSTFSYKGSTYRYQIGFLYSGRNRHIGYVIRVYDMTNIVRKTTG
ncbi:MAG: hypothetical protein K6F90_05855 [Lachnospiraceae bacterium]|nr:hypothetical protein [Lachnospiraceae bacterium]